MANEKAGYIVKDDRLSPYWEVNETTTPQQLEVLMAAMAGLTKEIIAQGYKLPPLGEPRTEPPRRSPQSTGQKRRGGKT